MNQPMHPNNIAAIRARLKLRQPALADALDIKQTTLSTYETGKVQFPVEKARALIRLARGARLLIDLNHVYAEADLPPAPAQAAQAGG